MDPGAGAHVHELARPGMEGNAEPPGALLQLRVLARAASPPNPRPWGRQGRTRVPGKGANDSHRHLGGQQQALLQHGHALQQQALLLPQAGLQLPAGVPRLHQAGTAVSVGCSRAGRAARRPPPPQQRPQALSPKAARGHHVASCSTARCSRVTSCRPVWGQHAPPSRPASCACARRTAASPGSAVAPLA